MGTDIAHEDTIHEDRGNIGLISSSALNFIFFVLSQKLVSKLI